MNQAERTIERVGRGTVGRGAEDGARAAGGLLGEARLIAGDIKLAHSVFALPFAVLGAFLAWEGPGRGWSSVGTFAGQLGLVVVCMVCARTWAMLFNRLMDRRLDARNPRTGRRVFAAERLTAGTGWKWAGLAAGGFAAACAGFWGFFDNPWPLIFSGPVLAWIAFYSLTKRFTWLCHVFLGGALAAAPAAAAVAIRPEFLGLGSGLTITSAEPGAAAVWWLVGMVVLWVGGFDVIYALQDVAVDRREGLYSVPARLGVNAALWISRMMHAGCFACLIAARQSDVRLHQGMGGWVFAGAVGLVGVLLVIEHIVLVKRGEAGLEMSFFTLNGVVSCVVGAAGVAAVMMH